MIIKDIYATFPKTKRVIVLTHSQELIEQDAHSIQWVWPQVSLTIFSSGLKQKDLSGRVIVAGIQSFVNVADQVIDPSIVLIDEAHMIPMAAETTYRRTLEILRQRNPKLVCIGLTATPWRMKGGHLLDCGLFNHVACDFSSKETFVRFVREGYLAKLTTKATDTHFDLTQVGDVAGEYNQGQLATAVDVTSTTVSCCQEMCVKGHNRNKWLIFAASISHAEHIAETLNDMGIATGVIHSKMTGSRTQIIKDFKSGPLRALVNMGVLTTGFDYPGIDMLVTMRPTKSVPLHIQMAGRGTRPVYAPGFDLTTVQGRLDAIAAGSKPEGCLWLDFAENIFRLGPINNPVVPESKKKKKGGGGSDGPPVKVCIKCASYCPARASSCEDCGHVFPPPVVELTASSSTEAAIEGVDDGSPATLTIEEVPVDMVTYSLYKKAGKPPSIRAVYHCGLVTHSSWLCFEHKGSARGLAEDWWKANTGETNYPATCESFLLRKAELQKPIAIRLWVKKPFNEILCAIYQGVTK